MANAMTGSGDAPATTNGDRDAATSTTEAVVEKRIAEWVAAGLLSERQAERLRRHGQTAAATRAELAPDDWERYRIPLTPSSVLIVLGCLLIACAGWAAASQVWEQVGAAGRFLFLLIPTVLLFGVGATLHRRDRDRAVGGSVALFFASALTPFAVAMGAEAALGHPLHGPDGVLAAIGGVSLAVQIAAFAAFPSPALTLPYPVMALWTAGATAAATSARGHDESVPAGIAVAMVGALLIVVAHLIRRSDRPGYAVLPEIIGLFGVLGALFVLSTRDGAVGWQVAAVVSALAAIGASCVVRRPSFLFVGSLLLVVHIFHLGFEYFGETAGLPLTLLVCGGLSLAAAFGARRLSTA